MTIESMAEALNALHPSTPVTPQSLYRLAREHGLELATRPRPRPPKSVPGQVEAFEWVPVHCTRCGRLLKHPHYVGTTPYGSDCATRV